MGGYNKKYDGEELEMIKSNLHLPTKKILHMINQEFGNDRKIGGLKKFISTTLGGKPWHRVNEKPIGSTRVTRGRVFVKTEDGWIKKDRIIAGAKKGEYVCYDQDGNPIAITPGEHFRLNKMGYKDAEKEVKQSMLLVAKVQQKALELIR